MLLVERKNTPGKGPWALPGGHINPNEPADQASLRELTEETRIKVPKKVLARAFYAEKRFDHPERSMRGRYTKDNARTVTMAFAYKLDDAEDFPRTRAGSDAKRTWWFTFEEIANMRNQIFEDHADIIEWAIAMLAQAR